MKILKNESGSSLMLIILTVGTVVALAAAGIINSVVVLNKEAAMLRSKITNQIILEQLGVMTLQAYNDFRRLNTIPVGTTATCVDPADPTSTYKLVNSANNVPMFCFRDPICVQDPSSATLELCDDHAEPLFQVVDVKQGLEAKHEDKKESLYVKLNSGFQDIAKKLLYLKNEAFASYDINNIFTGTATPTALTSTCPAAGSTLCKICSDNPSALNTGGTLPDGEVPCARFRVCPTYGGCDYGTTTPANTGWVIQKIGVLVNPSNP